MNNIVESKRIQYTSSRFAKKSLIFLQEVGTSKTIKQHSSSRNNMDSYLFFVVLEGNGYFSYQNINYSLHKNDCVFIDCHNKYTQSSDNWQISWVHFNGVNMPNIYQKFLEREGKNVFESNSIQEYQDIIKKIYYSASSNDYLKDMNIYSELVNIINLIMKETLYSDSAVRNQKYDINKIRQYIDNNYTNELSLDQLSSMFYINKFYLTRVFKEKYGTTIKYYILEKRITKSKEYLRFTDYKMEEIAQNCGIRDSNYFSKVFKKIEGITPNEYKKMW